MKKLLTLVLSLMLIISVVPTAAFAETGAGTATPQQSNEDLSEATIEIEKIIVEPCKSFCCNNPEQSGNNRHGKIRRH